MALLCISSLLKERTQPPLARVLFCWVGAGSGPAALGTCRTGSRRGRRSLRRAIGTAGVQPL